MPVFWGRRRIVGRRDGADARRGDGRRADGLRPVVPPDRVKRPDAAGRLVAWVRLAM
jgi:hypothetical protein